MVLVDSSIWITYFKQGESEYLDKLIDRNIVCINELILTELAPVLMKNKQNDALNALFSFKCPPLNIDWHILRLYQELNLRNGVNKVGIPDLIIIQQVIDLDLTLYSTDKHFRLMKSYLDFDLIR